MAEGRFSTDAPRRAWYPVATSKAVRSKKPMAVSLFGTPVAVFRSKADIGAVADRCPHRGVPLSLGCVVDGNLQCGYHGWQFDSDGECVKVPGLLDQPATAATRQVTSFPAVERDGFVWIWADPETDAAWEPFRVPDFTGPGVGQVTFAYDLDSTMHAAIENALDVPHTAFLHGGIFRGGEPQKLEAVRRFIPGGVEVQYLGEPVGFAGWRPAEGAGRTFEHWDRFFLPCVAQIEYRVPGWFRIVNTILHSPLADHSTRAWFVVRWWSRLPAGLVKPLVLARGKQILRQDAVMLAAQTENDLRHGGESHASTDLDIIGNAVLMMLKQAARGASRTADDSAEARLTFTV